MSKSLGNIVTIERMKGMINGQVIRLALLSAHYKQPLDWNENLINKAKIRKNGTPYLKILIKMI